MTDMNRVLLVSFFLFFSTPIVAKDLLQAPEFSLEFRTDFQHRRSTSSFDESKGQPTFQFIVNRAHIEMEGNLANQIEYKLRIGLNQNQTLREDGTNYALENWYILQKWTNNLELRYGKQPVWQGGYEGSKKNLNVYRYSYVGKRIKELYEVGISGIYRIDVEGEKSQYLATQILNQPSGGHPQQEFPALNFAWSSQIQTMFPIDLMVQYGYFPTTTEPSLISDSSHGWESASPKNLFSLGIRTIAQGYAVEIDMITGTFEAPLQGGGSNQYYPTTLIFYIEETQNYFSDHNGELYPFIKSILTTSKQRESLPEDLNSQNELQIGTHFYPWRDYRTYRYHGLFAYNQTQLNHSRYTEFLLNVGISVEFD